VNVLVASSAGISVNDIVVIADTLSYETVKVTLYAGLQHSVPTIPLGIVKATFPMTGPLPVEQRGCILPLEQAPTACSNAGPNSMAFGCLSLSSHRGSDACSGVGRTDTG
jgi:hypothetical protein